MPKTLKKQKEESIGRKKGVSIKVTKPRLTINGFVVDKKKPAEEVETQSRQSRGRSVQSRGNSVSAKHSASVAEVSQKIMVQEASDNQQESEMNQDNYSAGEMEL
jgi:hypothetical protein